MSMLTISPSASFLGPGMPCTTSAPIEMQVAAGKGTRPGTPLKRGVPPLPTMVFSTTASISRVVTPGWISLAAAWCACQTRRPAWRIFSIWASVLRVPLIHALLAIVTAKHTAGDVKSTDA